MNPEDLKRALQGERVPEHRTGFWGDLRVRMGQGPVRSGRRGMLVALQAAAVVIAIVGVSAALIRNNPGEPPPAGTIASTTVPESIPPTTSIPGTTSSTEATVESTVPSGDEAPWVRDALAVADVPDVLVEEWQRAENHLWCSALFPSGFDAGGATLRRAEFGGGWAVAWDLPELRSAFGVAGVGLPAWADIGIRMPNTLRYGDQVVGYGGEGFDDGAVQRLAEFSVPGQLCAYQVWSNLGDEHLLSLVDALRLVDGLEAAPIEISETQTQDLGTAPWSADPVPYPTSWPAPASETVTLVLTDGVPGDAQIRTTTTPMWSLAWDAPSGPGHDALNYSCSDCGRGVVGITVSSFATPPDGTPGFRWDDGSAGFILPRVGDPGVPIDRLLFRAPGSDELVPGAPRIDIYIPGYSVVVSVWSHLGIDSLFELVDGLRLADPGP